MTSPRLLLCCGTGGVGKTTTAAALGLAYAIAGYRTVVLTIDPARRLADALGLSHLDNDPQPVDLSSLSVAEGGSLHALMLDRKATFDNAVRDLSTSPEAAEKLLANRYYQAASTRLTGAHEYMATEKLHQLLTADRYDVIIVDTPPSRHAIDFFLAPRKVQELFDGPVVRRLVNPGRGLTGGGTRRLFAWVLSLVGQDVVDDIAEFFRLMGGVSEGFARHGAQVETALHSKQTDLLLVTTASTASRAGAVSFIREAAAEGLTLHGFVINRFIEPVDVPLHALHPAPNDVSEPLWHRWSVALRHEAVRRNAIAERHHAAALDLSQTAGQVPVWALPLLTEGLGSVTGLRQLAERLPPLTPPLLGPQS
ncbi:MAG: ArsA family ATPase [Deltaproteobacteria bacterium]|nr:MAG: ArsA family ATPase [Deltaproteobacteria bacterium]